MSRRNLIVVLGSGPSIGATTASLFASKGFDVALLSRNITRLQKDAEKVQKSASSGGIRVETFAVDIGDHVALKKTLDQVRDRMGLPEVVLFNAARISEGEIGVVEPAFLLDDFMVSLRGCTSTEADGVYRQ